MIVGEFSHRKYFYVTISIFEMRVCWLLLFMALVGCDILEPHYTPCPGVHQAFLTYNPAAFDGMTNVPSGLPIIKRTYNNNHTTFINGITCSFPDHVSLSYLPSGECTAVSTFQASALNYSESLSAMVSSSSSSLFGLITSTSSWAMQEAMEFQAQASVAVGASICQMSTHKIEFKFWFEQTLDPDFMEAVSYLLTPNYLDNIQNWLLFFSQYEIAQATEIIFGGAYASVFWQEMKSFQSYGSYESSYQAQLSIMKSYADYGGQSSNSQGASSAWSESGVGNQMAFIGGNCIPGSGCSYSQWFGSLFSHPSIVKASFTPISEYIALANKSLEQASKDAISNISTINMLKTFIVPMAKQYSATFNNYNVPDQCSADIPICANAYPGAGNGQCCLAISDKPFPDISLIQQNNNIVQKLITSGILIPSQNAINSSWISQQGVDSILKIFYDVSIMANEGISSASCNTLYTGMDVNNNNVCPYGWEEGFISSGDVIIWDCSSTTVQDTSSYCAAPFGSSGTLPCCSTLSSVPFSLVCPLLCPNIGEYGASWNVTRETATWATVLTGNVSRFLDGIE